MIRTAAVSLAFRDAEMKRLRRFQNRQVALKGCDNWPVEHDYFCSFFSPLVQFYRERC